MSAKGKIKVIKKGNAAEQTKQKSAPENAKQSAREMVSTVSNWVTEFQNRRRNETRQAIEKFFSQQTQTSGV